MKHKNRRLQAGFTLVEILVVIVILSLLATIVGGNVIKYLSESEEDAARLQVLNYHEVVEVFVIRERRVPTFEDLIEPDEKGEAYLKQITEPPTDPWGNLYEIRSGEYPLQFEVISYGPDGQADTEDDISSKTAKDRKAKN